MKKKKLSEIAVNAATLNNQPASFYDHRMYGIGVQTDYNASITDMNANMPSGLYSANSLTANTPSSTLFSVIHLKRSTGYVAQIAIRTTDNSAYVRSQSNGAWSAWKLL